MKIDLRWDRLVTLGLAHRASQSLRKDQRRIPILMYHGISDALSHSHAYFETNTSPARFAQQMQYLQENGYDVLGLSDVAAKLEDTSRGEDSNRYVAITFDDGYRDFHRVAFPILKKHAFTATVFVVSKFAGRQPESFQGKSFMTWSEIREVHRNAIAIGSHTLSHPNLRSLARCQVKDEIAASKDMIEQELGAEVESFAYPFAFPEQDRAFVNFLRDVLQEQRYRNGVSTIIGGARPSHERFYLPRLPVNSFDDIALFRAKLEGGYDWLHTVQYASKCVRALV